LPGQLVYEDWQHYGLVVKVMRSPFAHLDERRDSTLSKQPIITSLRFFIAKEFRLSIRA
jgi:hypothetical protein